MDQRDVIFEYGKLQLNFVASQNQISHLATALAEANKQVATLEGKLKMYEAGQDASKDENPQPRETGPNEGVEVSGRLKTPGQPPHRLHIAPPENAAPDLQSAAGKADTAKA